MRLRHSQNEIIVCANVHWKMKNDECISEILQYDSKKGRYLERWIKLLAVMLEKGKGLILGKLRTTQLIEEDLQLLLRIFIGGRTQGVIEKD